MNSKTLYLKYRPQTLGEIVGQEDVVGVLQNSIKNDNLTHAYIFSGERGTGKTTTARAFAKELGIEKQDILELDAASNNGVDDIKSLTEGVYTLPFFSKYKMYILDEAHMLTKAASNAFLKTLEEPPVHVIFVLCTTDPEKMLETILSRCVKFNLKSPNTNVLSKFIQHVCEKENVLMGKEAVDLVALSGNGSFRDALSNLQKILAFPPLGGEFSEDFVSKVLGVAPTKAIFQYLKSLDGLSSPELGLETLSVLVEGGVDSKLFAREIIYFARLIILSRHKLITDVELVNSHGQHVLDFIKDFQKEHKVGVNKINSIMLAKLLEAENTSKNSSFPFLVYELLLM